MGVKLGVLYTAIYVNTIDVPLNILAENALL